MSYKERKKLYSELEKHRKSKVISYITGDRKGFETIIHQEVLNSFINHLDTCGKSKKISLYLYTQGGNTLAAWSLVNLIRQFCDDFEVIVPSKAHSAGTLICLGANNILMTKQATLGPIDPSVNTPLNPTISGMSPRTYPVSVEAIKGFLELIKSELGINKSNDLALILNKLLDKIHPLVLGEVYRIRAQIKMLAQKLLDNQQIINKKNKQKIINFLCSDAGSHDYTINRKEAKRDLNLNIDKPNDSEYDIIKKLFNNIESELKLNSIFDPELELVNNNDVILKRALIESVGAGSDFFVTEGSLLKNPNDGRIVLQKKFEGWRYENE